MRAALGVALVLTSLLGGPSAAQEAQVREARCWIGSSTFSAGASMYVGDAVAVCDAIMGWKASTADAPAAGCLLDGELSSVGAVVGIRNNDSLLLECATTGRWTQVTAEPQG